MLFAVTNFFYAFCHSMKKAKFWARLGWDASSFVDWHAKFQWSKVWPLIQFDGWRWIIASKKMFNPEFTQPSKNALKSFKAANVDLLRHEYLRQFSRKSSFFSSNFLRACLILNSSSSFVSRKRYLPKYLYAMKIYVHHQLTRVYVCMNDSSIHPQYQTF